MKNLLKVVLVLAVAAGLSACKKNIKDDANADMMNGAGSTEMVLEETTTQVNPVEVSLGVVHFALDKYNLSAEARAIVEANAKAIKAKAAGASYKVVVEGNCDDRGTIAYNIALGEKRAAEVKAYYVRLGIPAANVSTVSYGKEKPVCYEATQSCWAKNRRADTVVAVK